MARRRATERIDIRSLPQALPFQKCSGLSVHRGRSDYDFHFSIDVTLCGTGRIWPVSILRTEAVSDGKLPSAPNGLPRHHFALHSTLADPACNFATRVLSACTESLVGQADASRAVALGGQGQAQSCRPTGNSCRESCAATNPSSRPIKLRGLKSTPRQIVLA